MEFTSKKISELIRRLLALSWQERQAADNIMMMILLGQKKDSKGRWKGLVSEAIDLLDLDLDAFLAALISFWADCSEIEYQKRMASFSKQKSADSKTHTPGWQSPSIEQFPLQDQIKIIAMDMYGHGIGSFLEGIGPRAARRAKQLATCLEHPELTVQDSAMIALGAIGPDARVVLPEMMADIKKRGVWCSPFKPGIAVSRVIDDDAKYALHIASSIDPEGESNQVAGPCAVLRLLSSPNSKIVDVILQKYQKATSENVGILLCAGAELTERLSYAETDFFDIAMKLAGTENSNHRASAAEAFSYFSKMQETEKIITSLAADPDWTVRFIAHRSAANIFAPSAELIQIVVKDLGNFDGYDEEPHYSAATTLIQWGEHSKAVISRIKTWIEELAAPSYDLEGNDIKIVTELLDSLGSSAFSLKNPIEQLLEKCMPTQEEDDGETEDEFDQGFENMPHEYQDDFSDVSPEFASEIVRMRVEMEAESQEFDEQHDLKMKATKELAKAIGLPMDVDIPGTELSDEDYLDPWERLQEVVKKLQN